MMDKVIDKIITDVSKKTKLKQKKLFLYTKNIKTVSINYYDYFKLKLEMQKCKMELIFKYNEVGKYVSNRYLIDKTIDFTYDDKYKLLIEKIRNLSNYIEKLKKI